MGVVLNCISLFWVPISNDMGLLRSEVTSFMTGYFMATVIAMPVAGKLLSSVDIRKVVSSAAIGLALTIAFMASWIELWQIPVAGFFVGLFGSTLFVLPSASMISNWFIKKRGIVYGITMSCSGLAAGIGSPLFNACIEAFGWRATFYIVSCVVIVLILPWSLFVFRAKPEHMGLVPYGYESTEGGQSDIESFSRRGVAPMKAIFSASFICLFVFAGLSSFCHSGIDNHIPGFAVSLGHSAEFGALLVSGISLGSVIDKLLMGYLNDRIGVKVTTFIQLVMVALGLGGLVMFSHSSAALIVSVVLVGMQDSLMSVSVPLLIRELFGSKYYSIIHSWIRVAVGLFGATAASIVGLLFDITGDFTPAFKFSIVLYAISAVLIALAYHSRKRLVWEGQEREHSSVLLKRSLKAKIVRKEDTNV